MVIHICDSCKKNKASQAYKFQERKVAKFPIPNKTPAGRWSEWKEVEICEECAEWLISLKPKGAKED